MKYIIIVLLMQFPLLAFAKTDEDVQLKFAKLWGRIDELEIRIQKQEEKIRILEKGLMLGVIPNELLEGKINVGADQSAAMDWSSSSVKQLDKKPMMPAPKAPPPKKMAKRDVDPLDYTRKVREAQNLFSKGNYGQAISIYEQIEKNFPNENIEGQSSYWIGLSWFYLKEYDLSEERLSRLVREHTESPWIPNARFYRAKILVRRGLHEQALRKFKRLIESYPNSETSEMARHEIKLIRERI